ncbi:hypothetical protein KCP70_01345 [Salmonella enterica subsp. enterica]|nr:hypothetical protein KCP70_01345 [Salmonella enterica subsp. enterica]
MSIGRTRVFAVAFSAVGRYWNRLAAPRGASASRWRAVTPGPPGAWVAHPYRWWRRCLRRYADLREFGSGIAVGYRRLLNGVAPCALHPVANYAALVTSRPVRWWSGSPRGFRC